jgi:hypothetical protein
MGISRNYKGIYRRIENEWLTEAGVEPSLDSGGDSCANALAESIIGWVIHRRGVRDPEHRTVSILYLVDTAE